MKNGVCPDISVVRNQYPRCTGLKLAEASRHDPIFNEIWKKIVQLTRRNQVLALKIYFLKYTPSVLETSLDNILCAVLFFQHKDQFSDFVDFFLYFQVLFA